MKSLFSIPVFRELYFKHNAHTNNNPNSYVDFESGSAYKNNVLFQSQPHALQIQLGSDDFELCNSLQSKAGNHKMCAVYFRIANMPIQFASKVNNIYLVILCNSNDLKSKYTDLNNIWELIVNDIAKLENVGINVNGANLKGTLVSPAFDNLGANTGLGFAGSFTASYFCRTCLADKSQTQIITKAKQLEIRTRDSYEESLAIIEESTNVKFEQTKGVKFHCVLDNLNYFDIMENKTADGMHDVLEGAISELLKHFFEYCLKKNIFSASELDNAAKYHDYGVLNQSNVPSEINIDKKNLGQNASQSLCLFRNLPFIF